jgi:hypothetical protein
MVPDEEGRGDSRSGSDGGAMDMWVVDREEGVKEGDGMSETGGKPDCTGLLAGDESAPGYFWEACSDGIYIYITTSL